MTLDDVLGGPLRVVNVGIELFALDLQSVGVTVVHVDWRPPAGRADVAALLARLAE